MLFMIKCAESNNAIAKLTRKEFYDVYAVSLVMNKLKGSDKRFVVETIQEISDKYLAITLYAVRAEMRYATQGSYSNRNALRKHGIKPSGIRLRKERAKIDFDLACKLFGDLDWLNCYGGSAWRAIAKGGRKLEKFMPVSTDNLPQVIAAIDHLNDLAHNTDLYLSQYCTFSLYIELENKYETSPEDILRRSSSHIRDICEELML
ncbi:MAG: hypothetical protein HC888_00195 [Candidatus Competibacteraceae bacterium]|nr:hypothetical protein [Candidatus Competibacteraceae bacterium]